MLHQQQQKSFLKQNQNIFNNQSQSQQQLSSAHYQFKNNSNNNKNENNNQYQDQENQNYSNNNSVINTSALGVNNNYNNINTSNKNNNYNIDNNENTNPKEQTNNLLQKLFYQKQQQQIQQQKQYNSTSSQNIRNSVNIQSKNKQNNGVITKNINLTSQNQNLYGNDKENQQRTTSGKPVKSPSMIQQSYSDNLRKSFKSIDIQSKQKNLPLSGGIHHKEVNLYEFMNQDSQNSKQQNSSTNQNSLKKQQQMQQNDFSLKNSAVQQQQQQQSQNNKYNQIRSSYDIKPSNKYNFNTQSSSNNVKASIDINSPKFNQFNQNYTQKNNNSQKNPQSSFLNLSKYSQNKNQEQDLNDNDQKRPQTCIQQQKTKEHQEYQRLQEKLNFLENKIMSIKSNIDENKSRNCSTEQNNAKNNIKNKFQTNLQRDQQNSSKKNSLHQQNSSQQSSQVLKNNENKKQTEGSGYNPSKMNINNQINSNRNSTSQGKPMFSKLKAENTQSYTSMRQSYNQVQNKGQFGNIQQSNEFKTTCTSILERYSKQRKSQISIETQLQNEKQKKSSLKNSLKQDNIKQDQKNSNQSQQLNQNQIKEENSTKSNQQGGLSSFVTQINLNSPQFQKKNNFFDDKKTIDNQNKNHNTIDINSKTEETTTNNTLNSERKSYLTRGYNSNNNNTQEDSYASKYQNKLQNSGQKSIIQNDTENKYIPQSQIQIQNILKNKIDVENVFYVGQILKAYTTYYNDESYMMNLARQHLVQSMQALSFARMLKPVPYSVIQEKAVYLPKTNKKTIVFDLDETLIHCNESTNVPSDIVLPIQFPSGDKIEAGINVRPYCLTLLKELKKYYEIIVFTASHSCYANVVLDYLDPKKELISCRLYREHCVHTEEGVYVKDLRVIQNRNLNDLLIVDNASYSFGFQLDNGIPIIPFYDNKDDRELKYLETYLKLFVDVPNVRLLNKQVMKMHRYDEFNQPEDLVDTIYDTREVPEQY